MVSQKNGNIDNNKKCLSTKSAYSDGSCDNKNTGVMAIENLAWPSLE